MPCHDGRLAGPIDAVRQPDALRRAAAVRPYSSAYLASRPLPSTLNE